MKQTEGEWVLLGGVDFVQQEMGDKNCVGGSEK
jgi:hypothetical protein